MTSCDRTSSPRCVPTVLLMAGLALLVAPPSYAEDWTQWRGEERVGVWSETGIVEELPETLKVKWRVPINAGFSGPAVADGRVFITDWREDRGSRTVDGTERAIALDEETGEVLWTTEWPTTYRMLMFSYAIGPRATPTVDGDQDDLHERQGRKPSSAGHLRGPHRRNDRLVDHRRHSEL